MASDMSGYQGEDGRKRWKQESGGDDAAYNREINAWKASTGQADPLAATGGQAQAGGGTSQYTGPADTTQWQTSVAMTDNAHPDANKPSGDPFVDMIRNASHGSEDYARFSNAQILAWKDKYVPGSNPPKFKNDFGDIVDKPTESGPQSQAAGYATGEKNAGRAGGGGGGGQAGPAGGAGPAVPPAPTTFGSQLSYTGNPLTDMLLYQFNTGSQLSDPSKMNTFAMGQDRAEGGTGANADQQKRQGQLLQGGGLWWSDSGQDAFGGFRADQKNANAANPNPAAPAAPPSSPQNTNPASSPASFATPMSQQQGGMSLPNVPQAQTGISPMAGMMTKTWRESAGGGESPFEKRAF